MAIKKTILCDGDQCKTILNKDNGLCFRGGIFVVDDKYIEGEDSKDAEGVGGGLLGGSKDQVYHYCRKCFAEILGFNLTVKRDLEKRSIHPAVDTSTRPNWYEDK